MKQVIRLGVFETNSSSEHSISICNVNNYKYKPIHKNEDLEITSYDEYENGYSYTFTGRGSYEKAQMLLSILGCEIEEQLDDLVPYDEMVDYDVLRENRKNEFYNIPITKAFVNALKRYIGEQYEVTIKLDSDYSPFFHSMSYDESIEDLLGIENKDLKDVDLLTEVFYNIIFNPDIQIVDRYNDC